MSRPGSAHLGPPARGTRFPEPVWSGAAPPLRWWPLPGERGEMVMDLALYTSTAGRCVLMPECFLPSAESVRRYGPLRRCGSVHLEEPVLDVLWMRVLSDLERRPFAVLRRHDARRLLEGVD